MSIGQEITFGDLPVIARDRRSRAQRNPVANLCNQYVHPLGPACGVGYLLMLAKDVASLTAAGQGAKSLRFSTFGDSESQITIRNLYVERATRLSGGSEAVDENALYLVRVVDARWILDRWSSFDTSPPGAYAFNYGSFAAALPWLEETVNAGDPLKLDEIVSSLWGQLPDVAGAVPTLPNDIVAPENLYYAGAPNLWRVINDLLAKFGYAIKLDPDSGAFSVVKLRDQAGFVDLRESDPPILYDAVESHTEALNGPATIRVLFPRDLEDYGLENDHGTLANFMIAHPFYAIDEATGVANAIGGTTITLWDSTRAKMAHGAELTDDPENLAELQEIATRRKDAWLARRKLGPEARTQLIFPGLKTDVLGSNVRRMTWRNFGSDAGGMNGLQTEIVDSPGLDLDCDPARSPVVDEESADENFESIDFARPGPPNYPRVANFVVLTDGEASDGEALTPASGSDIFPGYVVAIWPPTGELVERDEVWVKIAEENPVALAGSMRYGRLMGVRVVGVDPDEDKRPLYVVEGASVGGGVRIGLVDASGIAAGTSATVGELNMDGTTREVDGVPVEFVAHNVFTNDIGASRRILAERWRHDPTKEIAVAEDCPPPS